MSAAHERALAILSRLGKEPKGAELGVFKGALSRRLLIREDLNLLMVDCWGEGYDQSFKDSDDYHAVLSTDEQTEAFYSANTTTEFAEDRRTILRMKTVEAAKHVEDGSLDFVFIDADHSFDGCKADIDAWWGKLKPGGLLCGHDYMAPDYPQWGVKRAVDEFAAERWLDVELGDNDTWFIRLPGPLPKESKLYNSIVVCCVKWGSRYGAEYVNVLADMVSRNLGLASQFVCFTDDPTGIDEGIICRRLPYGFEGWWNKLALFQSDLFPPKTRVVFFDLDVAIVAPVDDLIKEKGIAHDWLQGGYNSSVMVWDAGEHSAIWDKYDPEICKRLHGDQDWMTMLGGWDYLPPDWCASYRLHSIEWPPINSKVVCFHGLPKPADIKDGWVPEIWSMHGIAQPRYTVRLNVDIETLRENVRINKENAFPSIPQITGIPNIYSTSVAIVGGGPSVADCLFDIQMGRVRGNEIWALNGAHDWLIARGIVPDAMVLLDSRKESLAFLRNPQKGVRYYIANQCDPKAFEMLAGFDVMKWTGWYWGVGDDLWIGGGSTVGMKALCLAYVLGYRKFNLYGYDSSYRDGRNHAYAQPLNDGELMTEVVVKGHKFTAARWMAQQCRDFQSLSNALIERGCEIDVFGDGLLPTVCRISVEAANQREVVNV